MRLKSGSDHWSNFGRAKRSSFGKGSESKFGKEKRSEFGKKFAVAAPITAKVARATTVAVTRPEGPCSVALGGFSACFSLCAASATCVPYMSARLQHCFLAIRK